MVLGFVLKSAGTQAGPTDPALPGPRISVFGTIHPELFRLSAPVGSGSAGERIRLASIDAQVGLFDAPAYRSPVLTDAAASACANAPFEERFAALEDHPASFAKRFRSEEHTSELQSLTNLVCRLLLEKKKHTHLITLHST